MRARSIAGAEALARWYHPERGIVPPVQFIPYLEDSGKIDVYKRQVPAASPAGPPAFGGKSAPEPVFPENRDQDRKRMTAAAARRNMQNDSLRMDSPSFFFSICGEWGKYVAYIVDVLHAAEYQFDCNYYDFRV